MGGGAMFVGWVGSAFSNGEVRRSSGGIGLDTLCRDGCGLGNVCR